MKKIIPLLYLYLLLLPASACAAQPHRILALTPHICEMLYAIGAQAQLVGDVDYCNYPAAAKKLPRIGSYNRINVEAALRLKPDIAVVMSRNVSGVGMLEKMGVRIIVSNPANFNDIFNDLLKLGVLTGHTDKAKAVVAKLRERLQKVRAMPRSGTTVFYEVWYDPLLTAGGPSFISSLIHEAGGRNVFAGLNVEIPRVNVEAVIRARPGLIVIPLDHRDFKARRAFWEHWLGKGKVRFAAINPDLLNRPGPRLIDGLELLQKALQNQHPLAADGHR